LTLYFLATVLGRNNDGDTLSGPAKIAEYGGGKPRTDLTHLVMVAGHAIWMGGETKGVNEGEWYLLHDINVIHIRHLLLILSSTGHFCHISTAQRAHSSNILKRVHALPKQ